MLYYLSDICRWAWQNTHLTKRIADEVRITARHTKTRISSKTGRTRKRPTRPRASLSDKLANLHLLLRVQSFARWPLEVRFFCEDVFRVWQRWNDQTKERISSEIPITLDLKQRGTDNGVLIDNPLQRKRKTDALGKGGIDASYQGMKTHVEKSLLHLAEGESVKCAVCKVELGQAKLTALVCPRDACKMASHLSCLAKTFIEEDADADHVLPRTGECPCCKNSLAWVDLVKDLSLRIRGDKEVTQLLKKPRSRKVKVALSTKVLSAKSVSDSDEEERDSVIDGITDEALPDDWDRAEDDDALSITSAKSAESTCSESATFVRPDRIRPRLGPVIEDSEWDEAQVLD